jgi:hypothetical protein
MKRLGDGSRAQAHEASRSIFAEVLWVATHKEDVAMEEPQERLRAMLATKA